LSLVNDALKKARLEAARGDAANRNMPYPLLGRGERPMSGPWPIALGALGALVVLTGLGGFFLYRAGKQSAVRANLAVETPAPAYAAEASPIESTGVETAKISAPGEAAEPTPDTDPAAGPTRDPDSEPRQRRRRPAESRGASRTEPGSARMGPEAAESASSRLSTRSVSPRSDTPPAVVPAFSEALAEAPAETPAETPSVDEYRQPDPAPRGVESAEPAPIGENPPTDAAPQEFLRRADIPGIGPIELGGIAWSGDRPFALVNGRVVRPGDTVSGLLVYDIQPNTVRFRGDQGSFVFKLK